MLWAILQVFGKWAEVSIQQQFQVHIKTHKLYIEMNRHFRTAVFGPKNFTYLHFEYLSNQTYRKFPVIRLKSHWPKSLPHVIFFSSQFWNKSHSFKWNFGFLNSLARKLSKVKFIISENSFRLSCYLNSTMVHICIGRTRVQEWEAEVQTVIWILDISGIHFLIPATFNWIRKLCPFAILLMAMHRHRSFPLHTNGHYLMVSKLIIGNYRWPKNY